MKKDIIKNVVIAILALTVIAFISLYLLSPNYSIESTNMLKGIYNSQLKLSEYIGKLRSDTFDSISVASLMAGSYDLKDADNTQIKDNEGNELVALIYTDAENTKTINDQTYYKVNTSSLEQTLEVTLPKDSNITWYAHSSGVLYITYKIKPNWWIDEFNMFYIN